MHGVGDLGSVQIRLAQSRRNKLRQPSTWSPNTPLLNRDAVLPYLHRLFITHDALHICLTISNPKFTVSQLELSTRRARSSRTISFAFKGVASSAPRNF